MYNFKLAALLVSATLLSSSAFAHISLKGETPYSPPYSYWTGFYAGLNAGLVNHTMNITDNQATYFRATLQQVTNPRFTGGFQIGYRQQVDLSRTTGVYGLELSANFSDAKFQKEYGSPFALYQLKSDNELHEVCLLQFIGGIAADRTLLFFGAGLSWVNIEGTTTNLDGIPFSNSFSVNQKELGTAVSGGLEYAFSDALSARIKVDVIKPNTYSASDDTNNHFSISNNIVQGTLAINYNLDKSRWFPRWV